MISRRMGSEPVMKKWQGILWTALITVLCIACFPINPLIMTGLITTNSYPVLITVGWVVWGLGMVGVMAPMIVFPRRGGVPRGKSFVHTSRLVEGGIYGVVRHPQYLGGILTIFVTTLLWYPHWLFAALGAMGSVIIYMGCRDEDGRLIQQFGEDYRAYMQRVPGINIFLGVIRLRRGSGNSGN